MILNSFYLIRCFSSLPLNYLVPAKVGTWGYADHMGFRSQHPGGAQFVYADGHVSFINETINHVTYQGLSTRAGGEILDEID